MRGTFPNVTKSVLSLKKKTPLTLNSRTLCFIWILSLLFWIKSIYHMHVSPKSGNKFNFTQISILLSFMFA